MLKNLLNNKLQMAMVAFLVLLLVMIRAYEDVLFYDPLLDYFKDDFTRLPLPQMNQWLLFLNLFLRFCGNTILSLGIIHLIFKNLELTKFAGLLYLVIFILLIGAFFLAIAFDAENKILLFYIRRFLIQPLFLLLFIPGFYFQERVSKNNIS